MLPGKVPPEILKSVVFNFLGAGDDRVILGPALGQDASLIRVGDKILVASTDPITGSVEDIGWLAVNVNANDIATFGVQPLWFLVSILLPPGSTSDDVGHIMHQINAAALKIGVTIAGGHTEITEGIDRPIVVGFMLGMCELGQYVTSAGARPNDALILTKTVALEGTAILATEGAEYLTERIDPALIQEAQKMRELISVVLDGVTAFKTGYVTAMHDPTEGGLAGGIHEICDASNVGVRIYKDKIPVHPATEEICAALNIDILRLISSGCMLITCDPVHANDVVTELETHDIKASVIGEILQDPEMRVIVDSDGTSPLPRPGTDALWDALKTVTGQGRS